VGKQLLIETMPVAFTILEEASAKNGGRMRIRGVFAAADEINGNGRVYPEAIYDREIEKLKTLIAENRAFGEADHPGDGRSTIKNTAAMLVGMEKQIVDGRKLYYGEAIVLNTEPGGKNLQEIIRAGGRPGTSSRAWGSLVKGNWQGKMADIVQEDLDLKTFDFVIGQSVKGAEVSQVSEQMEVVNLIDCGPYHEKQNLKGGSTVMEIKTVEDLRKAYPDLCEQLAKDAVALKEKEVKESLQKEFDSRILKEVEAKTEEVKKAVIDEIKNSEEYKGMAGTLTEIAKLVKPYLSEAGDGDADEELEEKVDELSGKVSTLEAENKALKEQIENDKKAAETKEKVKKRIEELTAGKKHEKLLVEALADCKTVEEVDKKVVAEEARIQKLVEELDPKKEKEKGKGQVTDENKTGEQLTEEQKRQRDLAGIEEKSANA
jgi:outer membrane murein-binding lipoprotein Lpp